MSNRKQRDAARRHGRRALIKWTLASGAALGLPLGRTLDVLKKVGGTALADDAISKPKRCVVLCGGVGGTPWFQLMLPQPQCATQALAFHRDDATLMAGTDRPLVVSPDTPGLGLPPERQWTGIICGSNEAHTEVFSSQLKMDENTGGLNLLGALAEVYANAGAMVPNVELAKLALGSVAFDTRVPGFGARGATISQSSDLATVFNAEAVQSGRALSTVQDADLFTAALAANRQLQAASTSRAPALQQATRTAGQAAARLRPTNLASQLEITDFDRGRYGAGVPDPSVSRGADEGGFARQRSFKLAEDLIVTKKAFELGLMSCVSLPFMVSTDPHGGFDQGYVGPEVAVLKSVLDSFLGDLASTPDPIYSGSMLDNTVIVAVGDTCKTPLIRADWPDATPGNCNAMWCLSGGVLKSGWFGEIQADGQVQVCHPETGVPSTSISSARMSTSATMAVIYAVSNGNKDLAHQYGEGRPDWILRQG